MGEQKNTYIEEIKSKIDKWNVEIDKFQVKLAKVKAMSQETYLKEIEGIKAKRLLLESKIKDLQQAGEADWEGVKTGVDTAWKDLNEAIKIARSKFN